MVVDQERAAAQARSAEIDALLNRHRVSLAQSQKLVESWLPLSKEEQEQKKSKAEEESSSVAQFLRPELAGLGANLTQASRLGSNGLPIGAGNSELEKLRKQMMGKKKVNSNAASSAAKPAFNESTKRPRESGHQSSGPSSSKAQRLEESDSDSEGRASTFKSKRPRKPEGKLKTSIAPVETQHNERAINDATGKPRTLSSIAKSGQDRAPDVDEAGSDETGADVAEEEVSLPSRAKTSILDEIIASKAEHKKRKKKKKKQKSTKDGNGA